MKKFRPQISVPAIGLLCSLACCIGAVASRNAKPATPITLSPHSAPTENSLYDGPQCATPGMFFTTASVTSEYEYDDYYVLTYDDADANLYEIPIYVDQNTYYTVLQTIKTGGRLTGTLALNDSLTTPDAPVFTFIPEPTF